MQEKRPQYQYIADDLADLIHAGAYPVEGLLPPESQLAETYGVSRPTIRDGLRILKQAGYIDSRQGSGNRVIAQDPSPAFVFHFDTALDMNRYASETSIEFRRRRGPIPAVDQRLLQLDDPDQWLWLSGVRRTPDGRAISVTDFLVPTWLEDAMPDADEPQPTALFLHVAAKKRLTVSRIELSLGATDLRKSDARRLAAPPGSPALRIIRRYWATARNGRERLIEITVNLHPADRFEYCLELERPSPGPGRSSSEIVQAHAHSSKPVVAVRRMPST